MNLLITPALQINLRQREALEENNRLFFLQDERAPLNQQQLLFDPAEVEGIVCNFFFQHHDVSELPNLRFVQLISAGLDRVPVEELRKRNIQLYNAGATYAIPMAEWAVGKILEIYKRSAFFAEKQKMHCWEKNRDILELAGQTVVIMGFGNVGRAIAKRLRAFDVNICAVDIIEDSSGLADQWFPVSEMKKAIKIADIVVLTLPLTEETYHIIDDHVLSLIKQDAVLINIARGQLIDEDALIVHLSVGKFMGVAMDVFEQEPLSDQSPLWSFDRVIVTPHNSFVGSGNRERLFSQLLYNIDSSMRLHR